APGGRRGCRRRRRQGHRADAGPGGGGAGGGWRRGRRGPGADGGRGDEDGAEPEGTPRRRRGRGARGGGRLRGRRRGAGRAGAAGGRMKSRVRIVEVGPRDGLQNEKATVATADKIELVDRLSATGLQSIEATSFVSPKWVPQLADAAEVYAGIRRRPGVHYPALVPNERGYERAREVGVEEIAVFTAASEEFNRRNINASSEESLQRFEPILRRARADGVRVRGYVSTVLGCPYQGAVPLADVVRVARELHQMGCYEVSLGDTIGVGTPGKARDMLRAVAAEVPMTALAVHFHDTFGQALANILGCLEEGVAV